MSICCGPGCTASRAGALAAPLAVVACGCIGDVCSAEVLGSGSRMSAPSPRPSAFLGIGNDLLGELRVAFCALAMNVVKNDRLTKTWRFRKSHISRNHALKDLCSEKTPQVRRYLPGKGCSFIIHRQQDTFDLEAGIQGAPDAHQRVQ